MKLIFIKTAVFLLLIKVNICKAQKTEIYKTYTALAKSFGESKPIPKLEIIPKGRCKLPAQFIPSEGKIEVEECLIELTKTFGTDSSNALAIILGHELAHYYKGHEWCNDFSFLMQNSELGKKIKSISLDQRKINESQADDYGIMACCLSGFEPFEIYPKLLTKIYQYYHLPTKLDGYPSLEDRILISKAAETKISNLYPIFLGANFLTEIGDYRNAIILNNYLLRQFPSREIYNNLGVNNLLLVINSTDKLAFPFILPIEIDPATRIKKPILRGQENDVEFNEQLLLEDAKQKFEEAIRKDIFFTNGYINLAITHLLQKNYEGCLGVLNELKKYQKFETENSILIKSIAYFLMSENQKAIQTINIFKSKNQTFNFNKEIILKGKNRFENKVKLVEWMEEFNIKTPVPNLQETYVSKLVLTSKNPVLIDKNVRLNTEIKQEAIYLQIQSAEYKYIVNIKEYNSNSLKSPLAENQIMNKIQYNYTIIEN